MGNSSAKVKNKQKVSLQLRNFGIRSLPNKPNQWSQRIDHRTWNEFMEICRNSLPNDTSLRHAEYKKYFCYFWLGMLAILGGIGAGCGMGIPGGTSGNTALWVFAIIFGVLGFVGGIILFFYSSHKYQEIAKSFIKDTRDNLSTGLVSLNNKYRNQIIFNVSHGGNFFKDKGDADNTIHIKIDIEILVESVQYIPDQQTVIVQQPTVQMVQPQGQVIMVQMPDGRMVPAQIQGQAQPQQQVQYQPVQTVVVPQPQSQPNAPAYNPEYNQNGGGQLEPVAIAAPYVPQAVQPSYNPEANMIEEDNGEGGEGGNATYGGYNFQ